jgi:hypothetical protein
MLENWGSVEGDGNADAIIADRREGRRGGNYTVLWNFGLVAGCIVWYALTNSGIALALEILAASWLTIQAIGRPAYETYTMLSITERRVQLIEQKIEALQNRQEAR